MADVKTLGFAIFHLPSAIQDAFFSILLNRNGAAGLPVRTAGWLRHAGTAKLLKRHVALVLPEEVQEALVVARRHVKQLEQIAIAAASPLETEAHQGPQRVAREIARHERPVDQRPERLPLLDQLPEQRLGRVLRRGARGRRRSDVVPDLLR